MELFTDEIMSGLLERSLETATITQEGWKDVGRGPGSPAGKFIKWHTIADPEQSVIDDVLRIRSHPLVHGHISIYGYLYDVKSGRLIGVKDAAFSAPVARENLEFSFEDG